MSTRWATIPTRGSTEGTISLNMPTLRKMGALQPGTWARHTFTARGERVGGIDTFMQSDDTIKLIYAKLEDGKRPRPIEQLVFIDTTPCHYGGERPWFLCPDCNRRCSSIFAVRGRFACRKCQYLAYGSTQASPVDRARMKWRKLRDRLNPDDGDLSRDGWHIPYKPDGMHWETYASIVQQMHILKHRHFLLVMSGDDRLTRRFREIMGKQE